ncbi:MAG: hypothetical protein U0X39_03290 [Bacteroidales bacterium]
MEEVLVKEIKYRREDLNPNVKKKQGVNNNRPAFHPATLDLTAEGGISFFRYLKSFNLLKGNDILVIPAFHHYFYDENDFKDVRTIVFLKQLNQIEDRERFFQTLYCMLPPDMNFVGCFYNTASAAIQKGLLTRLSDRFNNLLDLRLYREVDTKSLSALLDKNGFSVVDMTELNGLTYFYSQTRKTDMQICA